jgi:hypothetical protein
VLAVQKKGKEDETAELRNSLCPTVEADLQISHELVRKAMTRQRTHYWGFFIASRRIADY